MDEASTRRRVLAGICAAGVPTVAGCLTGGDGPDDDGTDADVGDDGSDDADDGGGPTGEDGDGGSTDDAGTADESGTDEGATGSEGGGTSGDDLDLREANVVGVDLDSGSGGTRFSVTLIHDDDGEDGYANWWTVETRDGEELGRRELAHAHGTREFTRSETVSVPDDVGCVVVRGHDQTHAYGGQAALVSLASGATRFVTQGNEPWSFADADCP